MDLPFSTLHIFCHLQGKEIWCSPCQPTALVNLVTYPQLQLVVTVDEQGLIKAWEAETGRERASFRLPTYSSALEACNHPKGPFLLVSEWLSGALAGLGHLPGSGHCGHDQRELSPLPGRLCLCVELSSLV